MRGLTVLKPTNKSCKKPSETTGTLNKYIPKNSYVNFTFEDKQN